jgi:hypothetical protein
MFQAGLSLPGWQFPTKMPTLTIHDFSPAQIDHQGNKLAASLESDLTRL